MKNDPKRKFKNLLIDRKFQLNYIVFFVFYGFIAAFGAMFIIGNQQKSLFDKMFLDESSISNPGLILDFVKTLQDIGLSISIFVFLYALIGAFFALVFSHRISGPIVALRRHIKALKEGDYVSQVKLRKGDELKILEQELNELSEILKNQTKN